MLLTIACATSLAAQRAPDTAIMKVPRSDSATVHALAVKQSPQPANARVVALGILGDTAKVTVYTTMRDVTQAQRVRYDGGMLQQHLRYERRAGTWTLLADKPNEGGR